MAVSATMLLSVALGSVALAQHSGGGPPGGGPPPGGMGGGPFGRQPNDYPSRPPGSFPDNAGMPSRTMHGGLQLGPPGRWWKDDGFAKTLGLDRGQQHRMDDIFKANKGQLITLFKGLRREESELEKISRGRLIDESQIDAQIDRVEQARGELEKANAHMLLEIRKQLTPQQTERLDDQRPAPPPNDN